MYVFEFQSIQLTYFFLWNMSTSAPFNIQINVSRTLKSNTFDYPTTHTKRTYSIILVFNKRCALPTIPKVYRRQVSWWWDTNWHNFRGPSGIATEGTHKTRVPHYQIISPSFIHFDVFVIFQDLGIFGIAPGHALHLPRKVPINFIITSDFT